MPRRSPFATRVVCPPLRRRKPASESGCAERADTTRKVRRVLSSIFSQSGGAVFLVRLPGSAKRLAHILSFANIFMRVFADKVDRDVPSPRPSLSMRVFVSSFALRPGVKGGSPLGFEKGSPLWFPPSFSATGIWTRRARGPRLVPGHASCENRQAGVKKIKGVCCVFVGERKP